MSDITASTSQQIRDLIRKQNEQHIQLADWLGGTALGGPNADGRYPLSDGLGRTTLVPSPASFEDRVSGPSGQALDAMYASITARDNAHASELEATVQRQLAEAARGAAVDARNLAQEHRNHAGTHEANARYWAELAGLSGQGSSEDRETVERLAGEVAINASDAAQDAEDAAFSAALAATFDPSLYDRKADTLAASRLTGVIDPARIPILPSQKQFASTGGLVDLTTGQQNEIGQGSIVTTTDGRRFVYSGSGSKTVETSYVVLADVTPDWSNISDKPSFFASNIANVSGLQAALDSKAGTSGNQTINGNLTLNGTGYVAMYLDGAAGSNQEIIWRQGASNRWLMRSNASPENGSDAGSNFELIAYNDAGVSKGAVFNIARNTMIPNFIHGLSVAGSPVATLTGGNDFTGPHTIKGVISSQNGLLIETAGNVTNNDYALGTELVISSFQPRIMFHDRSTNAKHMIQHYNSGAMRWMYDTAGDGLHSDELMKLQSNGTLVLKGSQVLTAITGLEAATNKWITDATGLPRLWFSSSNGNSYYRGTTHEWRNVDDTGILWLAATGAVTFKHNVWHTTEGGKAKLYFQSSDGLTILRGNGFSFRNEANTEVASVGNGGNIHAGGEIYCGNAGWFRVTGSNKGIHWEQHGGGWFMQDASWMRVYGNKGILTTGTVQMGAFTVTSDRRIKTDFAPILNHSEIIDQTKVYEFTKGGRRQLGVIAQEAQQVVPVLVSEGGEMHTDGTPLLTVDMTGYIPILIEEVKGLRGRVAELEGQQ
ncbi:shufflon system plasmid conjugative transfer pilus tip adhesin PilV [Brevundimonas sp.]|uniref:shufflon system plasmid conjugative transfer pilus tip adhesin PilV n=4 Tax=Brevundimonas sp. TaxID=1871086 RepID=UPI002FC8C694